MNYNYRVLLPHKELINLIIDFYTAKVANPSYYENIHSFCLEYSLLKRKHNNEAYCKMGYLTADAFKYYALDKKLITGLKSPLYEIILEILSKNQILIKIEINTINNNEVLYCSNQDKDYLNFYRRNDLFLNRILGFEFIATKYERSVLKITVKKNGTSSIGAGFVIGRSSGNSLLITNYHVIDGMDKVEVLNYRDEIMDHKIIASDPKFDLAVLSIDKNNTEGSDLLLTAESYLLDEILTIGYPPVPTTKNAYPLFHLGEINSNIETYFGLNLFLFSAKTNPGNSGGPVLNKDGMVIGIVTQLLEEKDWYKYSKLPYCAAVPAKTILEFLIKNNM